MLRIILFILFLIVLKSTAQENGTPLITNYSPDLFNAEPQIWTVIQDKRGLMYFGASDCVLEFDGTTWRKIYTPKKQVVRSLYIDKKGRIYVGSNNNFGYLEPDSIGSLTYISISDCLDSNLRKFEDVWETIVTDDCVYFGCSNYIFRYYPTNQKPTPADIEVFKAETSFFLLFKNKNDVYTYQRKKGLSKLCKENIELVEEGAKIRTWFMLPYPGNKIFIGSMPEGLFVYDPLTKNKEEILSKKYFNHDAIKILEAFLAENQLYNATVLNDGRYALATIRSGIVIIDKRGNILQHIYKGNGLQSQTVHYLFQDRQGGLWAALTYGISRIEAHYPVSLWNEKTGLVGSIYNVIRYENRIYASSNLGLQYLENGLFYPVEELAGRNAIQVFDLKNFKINEQNIFLATATNGIWQIKGKEVRNISQLFSFGLYQSPFDSAKIYVPDGNDIYLLEYINGKWNESKSLISFAGTPSNLIQVNSNELWCVVDNNPVLIKIKTINNEIKFEPFFFTEKKNPEIKELTFNGINIVENSLHFMTNKGIYLFQMKPKKFLKTNKIFGINISKFNYDFVDAKTIGNSQVLFVKKNNRLQLIQIIKENGKTIVDSSVFKRLRDIESYYSDGDSLMWFVSSKNLYKFNWKNNFAILNNNNSLIRNVLLNGDSIIFNGAFQCKIDGFVNVGLEQLAIQKPIIKYIYNDIVFNFSAPEFDNESLNEYSYFLEGDHKQSNWSAYSSETKKEYTNLSEGDYIFRVKSKNIFGHESKISSYSFTILPPWHRTIWAYILYILFFIGFIWLLLKLNSKRHELAKKKLEQIVKERTIEIMEQNEQILQQKEELLIQTEMLESINLELEKLSLVARETDNAILIADAKGTIEWINQGFTRLYGYTLEEFKKERGTNFIGVSSNSNIREFYEKLLINKKSVIYETPFETKQKTVIWSQTTLTPIFNEDGEIIRIIAIDSDITKMKLAEDEIGKQREEIESQRNYAVLQRDEIIKQKKELTDSIRYALQIQESMLPTDSLIKSLVQDYFILYKPRNIVSGDFYWINEVENKIIVSVGDCTGHGVPGAFMSLLGITYLKEIVVNEYITHPAVILKKLRKEVIKSLKQRGKELELKDGMDISLCVFDKETKILEFSGANNSAILINDSVMVELKADRMPIGIYETMDKFSLKQIQLKENDIIYLFTDGYKDQFNGKSGKKFLSKRFKKLIQEISTKTLIEQKIILEEALSNWKGSCDQVDDITVLGLKFF
ncbi:MAG: hypothetical protein A2X08_00555 [Bacteroidetes bacterium GWA2_32_17]|nr:MAG: hypothetical protein A2X08_00555 [Bacteroidetes bacterium GWA2_32_17]